MLLVLSKEITQGNFLFIGVVENVVDIMLDIKELPKYLLMIQLLVFFLCHLIKIQGACREGRGCVLRFERFGFWSF
jgi:hypothetical protein